MATFELGRKKIILMVILSVFLATLMFFAGWLVGARRSQSVEPSPTAEAGDSAPSPAETAASSGPTAGAPRVTGPTAPRVTGPTAPRATGSSAMRAAPRAAADADEPSAAVEPGAVLAELGVKPSFTIQVGSFLITEDAELFVQDLTERGYPAAMETLRGSAKKRIHKVTIGTYKTYSEAERAAEVFAMQEGLDAIAVRVRREDRDGI